MTTTVVYGDAADGYVSSTSGVADDGDGGGTAGSYSEARAGSTLTSSATDTAFPVGQLVVTVYESEFAVYESFLAFDTSGLPDTDTVSAAILRVTSDNNSSTTDFDIQARLSDWGTSLTTADFVAGASLSGLTLLGSYSTASGFTAGTGYDFSDTAMAANVSKTGVTRMLLCSSRTVSGTGPSGSEYVFIRAADYTGTTSDPRLTITHAAGGGENHDASPTATGGGITAPAISTARSRTATATGGGSAAVDAVAAETPGLIYGLPLTGGGVASPSTRKGALKAATATGGGVVATTRTTNRLRTGALTGGGVSTVAPRGAHTAAPTATGSGTAATATTTQRSASPTATAGGRATVDAVAVSGEVNRNASVTATGAGAATASVRSARQLAAALSGGGVLTLAASVDDPSRPVDVPAYGRPRRRQAAVAPRQPEPDMSALDDEFFTWFT